MTLSRSQPPPQTPTRVAIFGGGITGLTAAHELVERGFEVEVFEPEPPSLLEWMPGEKAPLAPCTVGGIARTQWSRANRPDPYGPPQPTLQSTRHPNLEKERELSTKRVHFDHSKTDDDVDLTLKDNAAILGEVKALIEYFDGLPEYGEVTVQVRGCVDLGELPDEQLDQPKGRDKKRADAVKTYLTSKLGLCHPDRLVAIGLGLGSGTDFTVPDNERRVVTFRIVQDYIPGEHGFRFFPTFYRNLRDTLKRTPVPVDENEPYVETFRTVFDNLVPAPDQAVLMYPPRPPYILPRRRVTSLQELFDLLVSSLETSGFTFSDVNRWALVLFKYMTSCAKRRAQYESLSWWDFVGACHFSEQFQKYLVATPQGLVAFTPKECDARTYGNITIQLLRDQLIDAEVVDGVLNGPTSVVWLDPWRRYLESQGVSFRRGRLTDFQVVGERIFAEAVIGEEIEKPTPLKTLIVRDYYVIALPVDVLQNLIRASSQKGILIAKSDDARRIFDLNLGDPQAATQDGDMRHLSGIQFYFPTPLTLLRGHAMYADSEWGLSSISQPQFWVRKRGWWDGYRSVLTVGIGNWDNPIAADEACSAVPGKKAWECDRDHIAAEIWRQIKKSIIPRRSDVPCPEKLEYPFISVPTLYHLDEAIVLDSSGKPHHNEMRMLMNRPGQQTQRPGRLDQDGYDTWFNHQLVFAGTYMKTHTRLTTMEAANESARHAVNGILSAHGYQGDRCKIEPPEEHELPDLKYFIDLDAELCEQGLPHLVDILSPTELPRDWLKGALDLRGLAPLLGLR
jgi:hypothetical protein